MLLFLLCGGDVRRNRRCPLIVKKFRLSSDLLATVDRLCMPSSRTGRWHWHPWVLLVSGDGNWLVQARQKGKERFPALRFTHTAWGPVRLDPLRSPRLVWWHWSDSVARRDQMRSVLEHSASRFVAGFSLVCWESSPDGEYAGDDARILELEELGYQVHSAGRGGWELGATIAADIIDSSAYLLPGFMKAIGCDAREVAEACEPLVLDPKWARTVNRWGQHLGRSDRHGVEAMFHRHHVGVRPWAALNWGRLLGMVDWVIRQPHRPRLVEIGDQFKMGTPKNLNRWARRVTGFRFLQLVEIGPRRMLRLLAERVRGDDGSAQRRARSR